jgi:DNA-binding HxlR family transcriptional regulator
LEVRETMPRIAASREMWRGRLAGPSLFFILAIPAAGDYIDRMSASYGQFCPIAKASEIFANRWTPLIVRELMAGADAFNDIHRGVPLISRAVLVARLRELEDHGVIERKPRADGAGHAYCLTPAGVGLRAVMAALGQWGVTYTQDRIKRSDLDPALLVWGLRRRVDMNALPDRRVVLRFEFSGVPASRTKFRIMWLILRGSGVDVCMKDPGFAVDLTLRGNIRDYVEVYLGYRKWRDAAGTALQFDGDPRIARALPVWLGFEAASGRNAAARRLAAGADSGKTDHFVEAPRRIRQPVSSRRGRG